MDQISAVSDAFGPVTLSRFAAAPTSAHLLRAQHGFLARQMDSIAFEAHSFGSDSPEERGNRALGLTNALTSLKALLAIHHTLESGLMHKVLASDPRHRMLAEQSEREAMAAMSGFDKLLMAFSSPSLIFEGFTAFSTDSAPVFMAIKERFKAEERDLFSVFDRVVSSHLPLVQEESLEVASLANTERGLPTDSDFQAPEGRDVVAEPESGLVASA